MKSQKTKFATKENSCGNLLEENQKAKTHDESEIEIIDSTMNKKIITNEEMKRLEKTIEARLRLRLKSEYFRKYRQMQNMYEQEMLNSTINMKSPFFESFYSFSSYQSIPENQEIDSLSYEKEVEEQRQKYLKLLEEKQKNSQTLQKAKNELSILTGKQEKLEQEMRFLSAQINDAYQRNSELALELDSINEQNRANKMDSNENAKIDEQLVQLQKRKNSIFNIINSDHESEEYDEFHELH